MALLFLYHNSTNLLAICFLVLALFVAVNTAVDGNFVTKLQIKRASKALVQCQRQSNLANFCKYVPSKYKHQWQIYCKGTQPAQQVFTFFTHSRYLLLVFPMTLATATATAVMVASCWYYQWNTAFFAIVWLLVAGWLVWLMVLKLALSNKRTAKRFAKLVVQMGAIFDAKLPFVVPSQQAVDQVVGQIKLLQNGNDCHQQVQQLLKQAGLDGNRTVKQQQQINQALSSMLSKDGM